MMLVYGLLVLLLVEIEKGIWRARKTKAAKK
jgi:hypothetical protein